MLKALCESYGERLCKETLFVVTIFISAGWWQDVADFTYNLILSSWHIKKSWLHHFCAEAINRTSLSSFLDIFSKWVEVQFGEWSLSWCVLLQTDHKMYFSSPSAESFVQQAQVPCTIRRIKLCSWTSLFQVFFLVLLPNFYQSCDQVVTTLYFTIQKLTKNWSFSLFAYWWSDANEILAILFFPLIWRLL